MSTVLYIKANAKSDTASRTFRISEKFIEAYKQSHPGDQIVTLDLYKEKIAFLSEDDINTVFGPKNADSMNHPILKYAYQFAGADKFVIAEPMWNLSIPAILKAYIDYVTVTGVTFKYTENGPVGLLEGKKAVNIVARGGNYCSEATCNYEMGERYLKTIFGFYGITDFSAIIAENLDIIGADVEGIVNAAIKHAQEAARTF